MPPISREFGIGFANASDVSLFLFFCALTLPFFNAVDFLTFEKAKSAKEISLPLG
jgi:hypothetical protein